LSLYQLCLGNSIQLEARIIRGQGPWSYPGSNWARDHFLLLLLRLVLHILLVLLVLLLVRLLISRPRKGGISIIFPMSRLPPTLLLHHIPGALLLMSGGAVTPATTGRACSLPGWNILAGTLVADILVSLASILLNYRLFFGDCWIIHLDLLVPAARGHTSGTPGAWMRGRGLAPRPRAGSTHRRNVLRCAGTWICLLKGLLLLASFRQKLVKPGLLLTQCFAG
jgi:hypothetical protein